MIALMCHENGLSASNFPCILLLHADRMTDRIQVKCIVASAYVMVGYSWNQG